MSQQIRKRSLKQFAVDGDKLRLEKDQQVRALNSSNVEVSLIKLDSSDKVVVFNPAINGTDEVAFKAASEAYTDQKISDLVNGAPALLDTLQELAAALGSDENFASTVLNRFSEIESDLSDEISRAQIAEQSLASSISSEAQSRIDGDASEQSRAQMAEQSLASSISDETFARIASVNAEQSRAEAAEASLSQAFSSEQSRSQASDQSLSQAISSEQSRAQASEQSLSQALSSEQSRAQASEQSLSQALSSEQSRAQASEQSLSQAISSEQSRAQAAEALMASSFEDLDGYAQDIRSDLDEEISRAQASEQSLSQSISSEQSRAQIAEASLASSVSSEKNRAELAEQSLSNAIAQEILDRDAAIVDEENRAQEAESSLAQAILNEKNRAESVESSLASSVTAEKNRAELAEQSLASSIAGVKSTVEFIQSNIDPAAIDSLTEIVDAFQTMDGSLQSSINLLASNASSALASETSRAQAAEASLAQSVLDEMSRAQSVEASISGALAQEVLDREADVMSEENRAQLAEGSLAQAILDEKMRAEGVEQTIQSDLGSEIQARIDGDNYVVGLVEQETSRANSVEMTIQSDLGNEISRAQSIEGSLQAQIDALSGTSSGSLSDEISRAMAAEQALQDGKVAKAGDVMTGSLTVQPLDSIQSSQISEMQFVSNGNGTFIDNDDNTVQAHSQISMNREYDVSDAEEPSLMAAFSLSAFAIGGANPFGSSINMSAEAQSGISLLTYDSETGGYVPSMPMGPEFLTTQAYVEGLVALRVAKTGDSMSGNLFMSKTAGYSLDTTRINGLAGTSNGETHLVVMETPRGLEANDTIVVSNNSTNEVYASFDGSDWTISNPLVTEISAQTYSDGVRVQVNIGLATTTYGIKFVATQFIEPVSGFKVTGLEDGTDAYDAVNKSQLDAQLATVVGFIDTVNEEFRSMGNDLVADIAGLEGRISALEVQTDGPYFFKQKETISDASSFSSVTLSNAPIANSVCVQLGRLMLIEGEDYSVSGSVVTLMGDVAFGGSESIENGDVIIVSYAKDV